MDETSIIERNTGTMNETQKRQKKQTRKKERKKKERKKERKKIERKKEKKRKEKKRNCYSNQRPTKGSRASGTEVRVTALDPEPQPVRVPEDRRRQQAGGRRKL